METNGTSALAIAPNPREMALLATVMRQALLEMRSTLLKPGVDYGIIPGTKKDTLLKPGAEKLASGFKLYPIPKLLTGVEDWNAGFFYYRYQIDLMHRETGQVWGTGIGSCNSREKKYGYRWVTEAEVPADLDKDKLVKENGTQTLTEFDFAIKKAVTDGKYGKPAEYWQQFKDAIEAGTAKKIQKEMKSGMSDAWQITIGASKYRIPNPEIYDQVNTIDKMAFKRAYIAAVLNATNASEFFTQDMEDFMSIALPDEDDNVVEGTVEDVTPAPVVVEDKKPEAPKHWSADEAEVNELVRRACDAKIIPECTKEALLKLLDKPNFEGFKTRGDAALAVQAAALKAGDAAKSLAQDKTPIGREPVTSKDPVEDAALNQAAEQIADGMAKKPGKGSADYVPTDAELDAEQAAKTASAGEVKVNGKSVAVPAPPF